ncbi:hypothetical protein AB1K89_07055 [Sporosarcina sp. 179-K 8C2 HS]|uniref:hypothetical protein n=1 Tax=Sporosarcina sp. 179-K 8C2 HS TaxID=3142387 RepID=UPI0039A1AE66
MLNMEKSDVFCLVCNHQFSICDAGVIEEWELPICDPCIDDMCTFKVKYDGSDDLLEFLTQEIRGGKCPGCLKSAIELQGIRYGSTVWGDGRCSECKQGWSLEIHIEFV